MLGVLQRTWHHITFGRGTIKCAKIGLVAVLSLQVAVRAEVLLASLLGTCY